MKINLKVDFDNSFNIKKDDQQKFHTKGFLHLEKLFDPKICTQILSELKNLESQKVTNSDIGLSTYIENLEKKSENYNGISYLTPANVFCLSVNKLMQLKLLKLASILLNRQDCFFSYNELHIRQPNIKHSIPSHQDNFYFSLKQSTALTCYVFLTEQSRNSGGLGFLPCNIADQKVESHLPSKVTGFSSFVKEKEDIKDLFEYPRTNIGDVIFHHCTTFHRADSNQSNNPTVAASLRVFSAGLLEKDKILEKKYLNNRTINRAI